CAARDHAADRQGVSPADVQRGRHGWAGRTSDTVRVERSHRQGRDRGAYPHADSGVAMDFEFRFDDAKAFAARMDAAPQIVGDELTSGIDRLTLQGEAFTKAETPVRTGHLRRSIAHKPATFGGGVATGSWGTATPYARYVEEGRGPVVARGRALRFV